MLNPKLPEPDLLKAVLQPLLEDFGYWFERSRQLLEREEIPFLNKSEQFDLLNRVKQAQQEVNTAKALFQATGGQVGVETTVLMPWHHLLTECWQVTMRFRKEQPR
ncbi:MAG: DUF2605 domain-containing protein [Okeania sp. SIO3I5]|uniref:DUF2605 domain-containing protein n=1 Tax=Okeania sp. SIO3I5 TaxID=2607805 RepID=UPI0013BB9A91|nr:DUF2605 domain-containing protein [Okeania sp. SIO3I5]NEQ39548.1 DUF2605 domain-containing protein [Okeania sp. SIO3I5]